MLIRHRERVVDVEGRTSHRIRPAAVATDPQPPGPALPPEHTRLAEDVRRLPRRSRLRQLAERAWVSEEAVDADPDVALQALIRRGGRRREREVAVWLLTRLALSHETTHALSEQLARAVSAELRAGTARTVGRWLVRAVLVWMTYGLTQLAHRDPDLPGVEGAIIVLALTTIFFTVFTSPITVGISWLLDQPRRTRLRCLIRALGNLADPTGIGALADANSRRTLRGAGAAPALRKALAPLTAEQYGQMPAGAIQRLCSTLVGSDEATGLAVLEALQKVGGGSAVGPIERFLARFNNTSPNPTVMRSIQSEALQRKAEETLAILRERAKAEQSAEVLLRPAMLGGGAETLLRASQENGAPAEELLRAAELPERAKG